MCLAEYVTRPALALSGAAGNESQIANILGYSVLQGCKPAYVGSYLATFQETIGQIFQDQAAQEHRVVLEDGNDW